MSTIDNGGQAFPCLERGGNGLDLTDGGMYLRDYFAAKAMAQLIAIYEDSSVEGFLQSCAESAYQYADAMLKARKEGGAS